MIIEALYNFAVASDLVPSDFDVHHVEYIVDLSSDGSFQGIVQERQSVRAPKHGKRSGTKPIPYFLDKSSYVLGEGSNAALKQHEAYCALLRKLHEELKAADIGAVCRFLDAENWPEPISKVVWTGSEKVAFRVNGDFIYDTPSTRSFFRSGEEAATHTCMVTGEPCVPTFQPRLKHLPGSQGATLTTFNSATSRFQGRDAVSSYPLSQKVQEGAVAAWNFLTEPQVWGRRSAFVLRKAVGKRTEPQVRPITAFWTADPKTDLSPLLHLVQGFAKDPKLSEEDRRADFKRRWQEAREKLTSLESETTWLYVLTLQAFQGRAAVQDWLVLPVGVVANNLGQFADDARVPILGSMLRHVPSYTDLLEVMRSVFKGRALSKGTFQRLLARDVDAWPEERGRTPQILFRGVQTLQTRGAQ